MIQISVLALREARLDSGLDCPGQASAVQTPGSGPPWPTAAGRECWFEAAPEGCPSARWVIRPRSACGELSGGYRPAAVVRGRLMAGSTQSQADARNPEQASGQLLALSPNLTTPRPPTPRCAAQGGPASHATSASPASSSMINSGSGTGLTRTRASQSALCNDLAPGLSSPATATSLKTVCGIQHSVYKAGRRSSRSSNDSATYGLALITAQLNTWRKLRVQFFCIHVHNRHTCASSRQQKHHSTHAAQLASLAGA